MNEEQKYRGNGENQTGASAGSHVHNRSSAEIEQDIERTRGAMDRTLDALLQKLTPGQLMDEALARINTDGARDFAGNLGRSVKNNPIPMALLGVGLGWLMLGGQRQSTLSAPRRRRPAGMGEAMPGSRATTQHTSGMAGAAKGKMGEWTESAKGRYEETKERGAAAAHGAREKAAEMGARASAAGHAARGRMAATGAAAGERMQHGYEAASDMAYEGAEVVREQFNRMLSEQPLVLAGLGVALGAALGAALPRTYREDRWMGEARDEMLERARAAGTEALEVLGEATGAARDAAAAEAKRQGLTIEQVEQQARDLAERGKSVAEAGRSAVAEEAERQGLTREQASEEVRRAADRIEAVVKAAKDAAQRETEGHGATPEEMKAKAKTTAAASAKAGGHP